MDVGRVEIAWTVVGSSGWLVKSQCHSCVFPYPEMSLPGENRPRLVSGGRMYASGPEISPIVILLLRGLNARSKIGAKTTTRKEQGTTGPGGWGVSTIRLLLLAQAPSDFSRDGGEDRVRGRIRRIDTTQGSGWRKARSLWVFLGTWRPAVPSQSSIPAHDGSPQKGTKDSIE